MWNDRILSWGLAVTIVVFAEWHSLLVPGLRRQSHYDVLLLVEGVLLGVDNYPRPSFVVVRFERIRGQDDVSSFEIIEWWISTGHSRLSSSS